MKLPFFKSFFKNKNNKTLELPESLLLKKLKQVAGEHNLPIFENITIYHHNQSYFIPLIIADSTRGIFLFEYKDWSYDDLKNAKIEKASKQTASNNNLAFEKSHDIIKRKFNELTHSDGVPIFNYLLMENLNSDQYEHLEDSFHALLPEEKVMFNDSSPDSIFEKMLGSARATYNLPNTDIIMSTLLIQYAILSSKEKIHFASQEQREFINAKLAPLSILQAPSGSGKTSCILLKAILEKLKNPHLNIVIIKPTHLACDILKKQLLDSIENAIVEINPTSIHILTPNDFIDNVPKNIDLIICDDSWSYSDKFIQDLKVLQSNKYLIITQNSDKDTKDYTFSKNFKNETKDITYHKANQHAKALQVILSLLLKNNAQDILVVGDNTSRLKLKDDLHDFIKETPVFLYAHENLIEQNFDNLLLATYEDMASMERKFVILMDIDSVDIKKLQYAYNLCLNSVYILYDDESKNFNLLEEEYCK